MRILAVAFGHAPEEGGGIVCGKAGLVVVKFVLWLCSLMDAVVVTAFAVPVDQNVNIVLNSGLNHGVHLRFEIFGAGHVASVSPRRHDAHGRADEFNVPGADQSVDKGTPVKAAAVRPVLTPSEAHSTNLDFGAVLDALHAAINAAFASGVLAALQSTVLANGANARGLNGGERAACKSESAQGCNSHFCSFHKAHSYM